MARLLAFPVRLAKSGAFETIEDGEDYYPQELAGLIQTKPGERHLVPEYGIEDPAFDDIDQLGVQSKVDIFGPPVDITSLNLVAITETKFSLEMEYEVDYSNDLDDFDEEDEDTYAETDGSIVEATD